MDQEQILLQEQDDYLGSLEVDITAKEAKQLIKEYLSAPSARVQLGKITKAMVLINNLPVVLLKTGEGLCDISVFYVDESGQEVLCDPKQEVSEQIFDYLKSTGEKMGQYRGYGIYKIQKAVFELRKEGADAIKLTLDVSQDAAEILTTITAMIDRLLQGS